MTESDYYRLGRLHRRHGGAWGDFWREHREAIHADFPEVQQRRAVVDALMGIVLMGMGEPVKPLA